MTMKSSVQMNNANILTLNSLLLQYLVLFWFTQLVLPVQCENKYYCNRKGCKFTCHEIPGYSGEVVINLSSLDGSSSDPEFGNIGDSKGRGYTYEWSPCTKFSTTGKCQSVYACQNTHHGSPSSYSLGNDMTLYYTTESSHFIISNSGGSGDRKLEVILNYEKGTEKRVSTVSEMEANHYSMNLFTKYAPHNGGDDDDGGISFGTILCIVFLVVLVLYLGIGIGYKYRNGAQGKDRIPNYEFWANMPGLIKDGCIFSANKTKECVSNARERTATVKSGEQQGGGYEEIKNES